MTTADSLQTAARGFVRDYHALREQVKRVIVGQEQVLDGVLTCLFVGGHCLLEGVPGLGKTLLVRTLAQAMSLEFSRIQFTPDLMPADILGTTMIVENDDGRRSLEFRKGPIFTQVLLADEINRATPKTQSALLETMQEASVTIGGTTHRLQLPFFVLATQNPIEQEGTYPLPEAQLDRFFFKVLADYPTKTELHAVLDRTTRGGQETVTPVLDGPRIIEMQRLVRDVIIAPHVQDFAVRLVLATQPQGEHAGEAAKQWLRYGCGPRGAQALVLAAKVKALLNERFNVSFEDLRSMALPALRHRILLNFEAQAEGVDPDRVLRELLEKLPQTEK
ncbi:MAG: MoxR family ATPase [Planctomycetales bacterium]|nr:MoxR family ATPase [Planctomycetales bacterium]